MLTPFTGIVVVFQVVFELKTIALSACFIVQPGGRNNDPDVSWRIRQVAVTALFLLINNSPRQVKRRANSTERKKQLSSACYGLLS